MVMGSVLVQPQRVRRGRGTPVRTYALYLHGRNASVCEAFNTRGVATGAIIGTAVQHSDFILRAGDTGISFHNHLHMAVGPGPDVTNAPPVANANVGNDVPFVFRDVRNLLGTDGVPGKLNWYMSTTQRT